MAHTKLDRPRPPSDLIAVGQPDRFVAAPELVDWIRAAYTADDGPLFDAMHAHLKDAKLGCLWTNTENRRHMRKIVGQAELVKNSNARSGPWARARAEQQLTDWFGALPDFVLIFDAFHAAEVEDTSFAALVDHELCHCAQERDEFGSLRFDRMTGLPKFAIRGHEVEEFTSVVRRFGIAAAGENAVDFVIAASKPPEIGAAKVAAACGNCLRLAA